MYLKKIEMFSVVAHKLDAEQSYQFACVIYNMNRFKKIYESSILYLDDRLAFDLVNRSLENKNLKSNKLLGDMYYFGYGVEVDLEKSIEYHIGWANNQNEQENFRIGLEYCNSKKDDIQSWTRTLVYIIKAYNQKKH
jgi:TPR repeat protein